MKFVLLKQAGNQFTFRLNIYLFNQRCSSTLLDNNNIFAKQLRNVKVIVSDCVCIPDKKLTI